MSIAPLILTTTSLHKAGAEFSDRSLSLSHCYTHSIASAGGLPWAVPNIPSAEMVKDCVARADGVLLTGGDDIQTALYGRAIAPYLLEKAGTPEPERDLFELQVIAEVFRQKKPLLAICRGLQILNVALGGTLIVDIPSQVKDCINHGRMDQKSEPVHEITVADDSLLAKISGKTTLGVNSSHHQSADKIAGILQVTARSADGVVEGLELKSGVAEAPPFLVAVQYHPERLSDRYKEHGALFECFVAACARYKS